MSDAPDLPYTESANVVYVPQGGDVYREMHGRRDWYCRVCNWAASPAARRWRERSSSRERERVAQALAEFDMGRQTKKLKKMKAF